MLFLRRGSRLPVLVGLGCVVACSRPPSRAVIGLHTTNAAPGALAIEEVARLRRPGAIEIGSIVPPPSDISGLRRTVRDAAVLATIPDVVGVVGPMSSRDALLAAPVYNDSAIVELVPNATSRRLRDAGPWTFVLAPDDSLEGAFIGRLLVHLGARRVTIVYAADEYGAGILAGASQALSASGVAILDRVATDPTGICLAPRPDNPMEDQLAVSLRHGVPDAVVLAQRQGDAACAIRALRGQHVHARYVGADGVVPTPSLIGVMGGDADSLYLVTFWVPDTSRAVERDFVARFRARVGIDPDVGDALAYDATMSLAAAIGAAGADRRGIRDWLASLGRKRPAR
jgi:branched-chain amino acid transport system substrate-binding protein